MSDAPDTEAVSKLLSEVVDSFEKLEILVHVVRAGSAVAPAPEDIAKAVGMKTDDVESCVKYLRNEGVFDPSGPWAVGVASLMQMYDGDRIQLLNMLTKTALERVRKQAARVFADAFVIKPARKKGDPDA